MSFSSAVLKTKLQTLGRSRGCIKTLSLWLIHHRKHYYQIVNQWMKLVLRAPEKMAVAFMYLANDVIQNSIQKGPEFKIAFATVLPKVFAHIGGTLTSENHFDRLLRILDIWQYRAIYNFKIIADYRRLLIDVPPYDDEEFLEADYNIASPPTTPPYGNGYSGYAGKLLEALANIEYSPSSDVQSRQRMIAIPESLLKTDLTVNEEDRKRVVKKLNEAAEQLDEYNARLDAELQDRSILSHLLHAFRKEQEQEIQRAEQRLRKYKKKLANLETIQAELRAHTASLPHVLGEQLPPLPTPAELFTRRSN